MRKIRSLYVSKDIPVSYSGRITQWFHRNVFCIIFYGVIGILLLTLLFGIGSKMQVIAEDAEKYIISAVSDTYSDSVNLTYPSNRLLKYNSQTEIPPLEESIQHYILYICSNYDIPPELLLALIYVESINDPFAISNDYKNYGLCQINIVNHQWMVDELNITHFLDPYQNIEAGVFILNDIRTKYHPENDDIWLMMYNTGPTKAQELITHGYKSTVYSRLVLSYAQKWGYVI